MQLEEIPSTGRNERFIMNFKPFKIIFGIYILFLITGFTCLPAYAQAFPFGDIDSIKREFMQGVVRPQGGGQRGESAQKKADKEAQDNKASKLKFPGATELLNRADVSFIDPDTYRLGPGDELSVIIFGRLYEESKVKVQPDGTIFIQPAGSIYVKGKTISSAERRLRSIMTRYYKNFKLSLQITKMRTIEVRILGEVANPGTYIATPTIGACDVIGMAGGIKDSASLRNLELRDGKGKKISRIDLYSWYYLGDKNQNRLLDSKYEVYVPIMQDKISLDGAFRRTGPIEIVRGERLLDVVKMAEPQTEAVLSEAKLTRISGKGSLEIIPVNLKDVIEVKNKDAEENLLLAGGDSIFLPELEVFLEKIKVIGELKDANLFSQTVNKLTGESEIQKVGLYNLKKGERVKDVIIALGGVTAKANMEKARVERPIGNGDVKVIPCDLRKLMHQNDDKQNIALEEGDTLIIPPMPDTIYLLGEIRSPGAYQYNVGNKIREYVALAGGPGQKAKLRHVKIIKEIGGKPKVITIDLKAILLGNKQEEVELRPGDAIYIPQADIATWRDVIAIATQLVVLQKLFD